MKTVRFAEYRQYEQIRTRANNAVMGLLAGAGMAAHLLQLTEGSDRLLSEIFPNVPHIRRLDMKSVSARAILTSGDVHLGAMTVPYVLGIHEDFIKTCLGMLQRAGHTLSKPDVRYIKAWTQHEEIERATGGNFSPVELQQFHILRLMRNCSIHAGGLVDADLAKHLASWDVTSEASWVARAGRSPRSVQLGDQVEFGHGEIVASLACTKALAREANVLLQPALSREAWADLVVEDAVGELPGVLKEPPPQRQRRIKGFARFHYLPLTLTETEISDAIMRAI
ncbi:hypothetical protein K7472_31945 [Streptomyces sp. PTM05]|uniref:Uncharacterized protein n=1 Tax=Streptantibioticus parmotrematis TaxID=2873249 RepID=A0ABS7R1T8_9ACTN|nr:hypothetical protein [Streptantibioticus parmotrematis]MBY8889422.1 hypothetical protein [Streptantibioticus parmotrematis]